MRIKIVEGNRIAGYGAFGNKTYPEYVWIDPPEEFRDEYGHLLYRWNGDKPVFDLIEPTIEEKEAKRIAEVDQQIQAKLPELMRIIALDDTKGFDDLKVEIKKIDQSVETKHA